ncbi:hypothetical protein [Corynebacterium liangguodongii]|uniref:Uncharacterized protein n=1 Tax=Corynebacterium liangguodongii TaxID=2079535 RepID=A0A2S0WGB5_9CORY|nr:hypothetical protein [Corynebacterium liangguodongii]AWB84817.1 hypothetical protein C3E79_10295 [Corynebacterium liangguodongii]PWB99174.1 hypothetical protein DF219_07910 [Corynebacterium liangguodongii]
MARIRSIKPEFWSSPKIGELDPYWRLLFIAMWNWADDFGRGTCEPRELMGFAFPHDDDMTVGEFRRGLGGIHRVFGVKFYRVAGRSYYVIPTWERHQKIDKRAKASKYPAPDEGEPFDPETWQVTSESGNPAESSEEPAESSGEPAESSGGYSESSVLEQGNRGTGEQGNRGTDTLDQASPDLERARATDPSKLNRVLEPDPAESIPDTSRGYPDGFERWWATYPRRVGKRKAFEAWYRAIGTRVNIGDLQAATERFAAWHAQEGTDERYIPHPTTWLGRDGWHDDLTPRRKQGPAARLSDEQVLMRVLGPNGNSNAPDGFVDGQVINQKQIG